MGTKMAPTYANLVLAYLEAQLYEKIEQEKYKEFSDFIQKNFHRYLDDCFIVWPRSKWDLNYFENKINNLHPSFRFTKEIDQDKIVWDQTWEGGCLDPYFMPSLSWPLWSLHGCANPRCGHSGQCQECG